MLHATRPIITALSLMLGISGCSQNRNRSESSSARGAGPAQTTGAATNSGEVFGYAAPADPRFDVSLDDVRNHVRNNSAAFIDARSTSDYEMGHVRGAINVPPSRKESCLPEITRSVPKQHLLILYCNGPHCDSAEMVSDYLATQGYTNMRVFKPGWKALSSAKDVRAK